ncbi:NF-kappa-B inhibitor zeta-like [Petromyzon marinus]|uniref:NF-kappa-B inhibitor zeta-like n=1 Tax=Petromyzon marinus TaxID=7757 RepID=A0AAJ7X418_PETMA|nr:NF-kappa-B inhibitor zeta-like [Petromyzon marinus]
MRDTPRSPDDCHSRDSGMGLSPRAGTPASPCYGNGGGPSSPPESSCSARQTGGESQRVYQGVRVRCTVRTLLERQRNGQATGQTQVQGSLSTCMEDQRYIPNKRRGSGNTPVPSKRACPSQPPKQESDSAFEMPEMFQENSSEYQSDDLQEILDNILEIEERDMFKSSSPQPEVGTITHNPYNTPEVFLHLEDCWPDKKFSPTEPKPQEWPYAELDVGKVPKVDNKWAYISDREPQQQQQQQQAAPLCGRPGEQPRHQPPAPPAPPAAPAPPAPHLAPNVSSTCSQGGGSSFLDRQIQQMEQKLAHVTTQQLCQKDVDGDTLLHIAVVHGQRALAFVLARKMASHGYLDEREHNGLSALHLATVTNQPLIVGDLMRLGAENGTTDRWGRSLIHVCAEGGFLQVLEVLKRWCKQRGKVLDVDVTNFEGLTPLHCAVMAHGQTARELQAMLERPQNASGAAELVRLQQRKQHLLGTVAMLLGMGASLHAQDGKSGRSVIHLAVQDSNLELLDFLLRLPTCSPQLINMKAYNGNTALHVAAGMGNGGACGGGEQENVILALMHYGADPSVRNLENEQPLHLVYQGSASAELVKQILRGRAGVAQRARAPAQAILGRQ